MHSSSWNTSEFQQNSPHLADFWHKCNWVSAFLKTKLCNETALTLWPRGGLRLWQLLSFVPTILNWSSKLSKFWILLKLSLNFCFFLKKKERTTILRLGKLTTSSNNRVATFSRNIELKPLPNFFIFWKLLKIWKINKHVNVKLLSNQFFFHPLTKIKLRLMSSSWHFPKKENLFETKISFFLILLFKQLNREPVSNFSLEITICSQNHIKRGKRVRVRLYYFSLFKNFAISDVSKKLQNMTQLEFLLQILVLFSTFVKLFTFNSRVICR